MLPAGFTSELIDANDTTIHVVRGGAGVPLVLLHGFLQDWYEWHHLLPRLAERYDVLALDLRGVGESAAPPDGYDTTTLATDVHATLSVLGIERAHIVGHDIGGMVTYPYARLFSSATLSALIIESLIPGTAAFLDPGADIPLWHGEFHMVPDLPEALVADRQAIYFKYFFDIGTAGDEVVSAADVEHYAAAYGTPERLHAAFETYRAFPAAMAFTDAHRQPIDVPLLLVGGEHVFGPALKRTAAELETDFGWRNVRSEIIADGRHYLVEEVPDQIATLIASHSQ